MTKLSGRSILVGILPVAVALAAWLFPFKPVGKSPLVGSAGVDNTRSSQREDIATIDDPDGYTNVRSGPGLQYDIVTKVTNDETFVVVSTDGAWWRVRTREGKTGYMHSNRIRLAE